MDTTKDVVVENKSSGMEISKDARTWAMLCHLSSFAGFAFPFGNLIAPLIIWLIKKEEHPFIDDQGKEALNFQISLMIFLIISIILIIVLIGIPLIIGVILYGVIGVINAAIKANDGIKYRYPINIRFLD